MTSTSKVRAVWVQFEDEPPRNIGQASNWNEAAIVFADWCERKMRGLVLRRFDGDVNPPNGVALRSLCMAAMAEQFGFREFPAFASHWCFEMDKLCPGYNINPAAAYSS